MSYRDICNVEKPFKRIKIKEEYLNLFLPEINYLKFLERLENFQVRLAGISSDDDLTDAVDLKLVRNKLQELKVNQTCTSRKIKSLFKGIKEGDENDYLLKFYENLEHCKNHLNATSRSIFEDIEIYQRSIYDLNILIQISDSLFDIRSTITVLVLNVKNLKESTVKKDIKKVLTTLYEAAISSLDTQFEKIKGLFPKSYLDNSESEENFNMSSSVERTSTKSLLDCTRVLQQETQFDYGVCFESEPCPCDAPTVPDVFKIEQVCEISASESSGNADHSKTALIQEFENEIETRKENLYKVLSELLVQSREISRIDNEIYTVNSTNEAQIDCLADKRTEIASDSSLTDSEKLEKLQEIDCAVNSLNKQLETDIQTLESQKDEIRKSARCKLKELKHLIKIFTKEHNRIIDILERLILKVVCKEDINEKIEVFQRNFEKELSNIEEYKEKISNLYLEEENVSSFSSSSETVSSSIATKSSLSKEAELLKVKDVKNDKEMYIKHVLGKALVQGLAAITIYQPTDPIYYLANYLLHYRYNELSNLRKQLNFEELLIERDKFSRQMEEEKKISCDPCKKEEKNICD